VEPALLVKRRQGCRERASIERAEGRMPEASVRATRHGLAPSLGGGDRGLGLVGGERLAGFRGPGWPNGPPSRRLAPGGFYALTRAEYGCVRGEPGGGPGWGGGVGTEARGRSGSGILPVAPGGEVAGQPGAVGRMGLDPCRARRRGSSRGSRLCGPSPRGPAPCGRPRPSCPACRSGWPPARGRRQTGWPPSWSATHGGRSGPGCCSGSGAGRSCGDPRRTSRESGSRTGRRRVPGAACRSRGR